MNRLLGLYMSMVLMLSWHMMLSILPEHPKIHTPNILSDHPLYPSNWTVINLTDFRFIINTPCEIANYPPWKLVMIVTSNARDFQARAAQRDAYSTYLLRSHRIHRVFLLAQDEEVDQEQINREQFDFQDLVQGNFQESYRNLSYKHIMGLKWASHFCSHARYVLKMDDDIMVDLFQWVHKLEEQYPQLDNQMLGYKQIGLTPQRDPKSKWYVSQEEYPGKVYPDFMSGWAYVTSPKTAMNLVQQSQQIEFNWIDDLWVSGILGKKINVELLTFNSYFTVHKGHAQCCLDDPTYLCDFAIAPSMEDWEMVKQFGHLATSCDMKQCSRRPWAKAVIQTCINSNDPFQIAQSQGIGEVFVVPNKL